MKEAFSLVSLASSTGSTLVLGASCGGIKQTKLGLRAVARMGGQRRTGRAKVEAVTAFWRG